MKEKISVCKVSLTIWGICSILAVATAVCKGLDSDLFFYEVWLALLSLAVGSISWIGEEACYE